MAKGKKSTLKGALSSQQSRLKKKQEAAHAAQIQEQKSKRNHPPPPTNAKGKGKAIPPPRPTIPFIATNKILLVGEGNFSFARALVIDAPPALEYLPAENITATAYDSEKECYSKYPKAEEIVTVIRSKGVEVLFGVDATKLERCSALRGRKFDKIVWNFPHAGKGITDQDRNILSNQLLLLGFLKSASGLLTTGSIPSISSKRKKKSNDDSDVEDEPSDEEATVQTDSSSTYVSRGTVLITLRNVVPYTLWDLPKLAKSPPPPKSPSTPPNPPYIQLRSFVFQRHVWKDYEHRMTKGERAHGLGGTGVGGEDRTWEFCLKDPVT